MKFFFLIVVRPGTEEEGTFAAGSNGAKHGQHGGATQGRQSHVEQMPDKMNSFEAWRTTINSSLGTLLAKMTKTVSHISELEAQPPPRLPPPPPPPWCHTQF